MKAVILAGGFGTRLSEETDLRPKPMVEVGGRPIIWHIMNIMAHYGLKEFFIALGYKGDSIKRYFLEQYNVSSDITIDLLSGETKILSPPAIDWRVHLIETGQATLTGGRIKRLQSQIGAETFMVTYGDGVSDVPIDRVIAHHRRCGKLATVTAVRPPARFGGLILNDEATAVERFGEKSQTDAGWINGGFIVLEPAVFDYLTGDSSVLEVDLLERLAHENQLAAYCHHGFWQCMDTLREKRMLEQLWDSGDPPWRVWRQQ
jgi:glucose-1-phosphate cytidylyltransferase